MSYSKIHSLIVHSSLWRLPSSIRVVFLTMVAIKDRDGCVFLSRYGLIEACHLPEKEVDEALKVLTSPDPKDGSGVDEGRRIRVIDGGWWVVNSDKYQAMGSKEDILNRRAEAQRRRRDNEKKRSLLAPSKTPTPSVPPDSRVPRVPEQPPRPPEPPVPIFDEYGNEIAANPAIAAPSLVTDQAKGPRKIAKAVARPQDPLFNTLAEECGVIGKPGKALGGEIGTALSDMNKQKDGKLTESDIRSAAKAYRAKWPNITMSPFALAKWMSTLNGKGSPLSDDEIIKQMR